jgi:hypothetical protein
MAAVTSSQVLETLYRARTTLSDPNEPYVFTEWTSCTCGHIYAAATGARANDPEDVAPPLAGDIDPIYAAAIAAVAKYNDVRYADPYGVSNRTASTADLDDIPFDAVDAKDDAYRAAALTLVNTAISKLEAEHETNRLDVLAQTRRIVDNAVPADVPVPAVA